MTLRTAFNVPDANIKISLTVRHDQTGAEAQITTRTNPVSRPYSEPCIIWGKRAERCAVRCT